MFYETELIFLRETLKKCRVQSAVIDLTAPLSQRKDLLLHSFITDSIDTEKKLRELLPKAEPNVIYRICDPLFCQYILLLLPDMPWDTALSIGPYLTSAPDSQQILEWAEAAGIQPAGHKALTSFYGNIPIIPANSHLFSLLETFCDRLWGADGYTLEDINRDSADTHRILPQKKSPSEEKDILWNMQNMELRYAYENELIDAVSKGQSHKADLLLSNFTTFSFEQRLADPVRNIKNYCIIMNTLLRKAAEKGGVHPVYLDSASSTFAAKIEQIGNLDQVLPLMQEMFRAYCRLVRKHATQHYSPPVQKAITYIDTDLTGSLSLSTISRALNISSSYLSTLFKKETGQTLTDYISHRRVNYAKHLLETTRLQVQTVAQHCGIVDVQYFSKVFKRITGMTPKEYRDSLNK